MVSFSYYVVSSLGMKSGLRVRGAEFMGMSRFSSIEVSRFSSTDSSDFSQLGRLEFPQLGHQDFPQY